MEVKKYEDGKIDLVPVNINIEINSQHYHKALDNVKNFAALNQLPFIMIPQDASQVNLINID